MSDKKFKWGILGPGRIVAICVLFALIASCAPTKTNIPADVDVTQTAAPIISTSTVLPTTTSTAEPTPLNFSIKGDSSLDISSWPHQPGLISYAGQSNKGYFAIVPYDENDNAMSAICTVNSFDASEGTCLLNTDGQYTTRLETKTTGDWVVKVSSLSQAKTLLIPGTIEGEGNEVIVLAGAIPNNAMITGNDEKQLFVLTPYKMDGSRMLSLANTIDPYHDTVNIRNDTGMIEVTATGSWSITVTAK